MKCPKCSKENTKIMDTVNVSWNEVYRKRKCQECGHVFYTSEFEVVPNKRFKREWNFYKKQRLDYMMKEKPKEI